METSWEDQSEQLDSDLGAILAMPAIVLDPNVEEVFFAIHDCGGTPWMAQFGRTVFLYFDALKNQLLEQGFKDDELLQQALKKTVTSQTFKLRVVKKLGESFLVWLRTTLTCFVDSGNANEVVIEDGVCYLQVSPHFLHPNLKL